MAEYIDRESITKRLERVITQGVPNAMGTHSITAEYSLDVIRNIPAADVRPVVHGKWIDNGIPDSMLSGCSICGYTCGAYSMNYCPNCGASMEADNG